MLSSAARGMRRSLVTDDRGHAGEHLHVHARRDDGHAPAAAGVPLRPLRGPVRPAGAPRDAREGLTPPRGDGEIE